MPGSSVSVGWLKLCHSTVPFCDRTTRLPVFMSTAVDGDGDNEEELATAVRFVVQTICPLASDKTRSDVLVMAREGNEELELPLTMIGVARLATQTTVRRGMLLYHMPRCSFAGVELDGAKKPKAKSPPSEMTAAPGESGLPETIRSSAAHNAGDKRRKAAMQVKADDDQSICQSVA
ncbi:Os09g0550650 [Oryza sativa Japonica Group]|uniref:Os09g0550650 protein n=1 Tax=Oryza sativa subsp. japonica TaxID=39947 RepID=A0A0N7KR83_ORYSJ|nr:hypothetical protein EE612_049354 [Oryza sativa]BAT09298.1 Os09g0550650 [Oryza sativa Japonica Group]